MESLPLHRKIRNFFVHAFPRIIRGKSNFMHEYLREIREKILNYYLAFIMGLLGVVS